jgi:addiction module HigA family antidote
MNREHPGEVLLMDFLKPRGLSQDKVAHDIGVPLRRFSEIVRGTRPLTAETSLRLGRYFGMSERFWIHLQADYDLSMERGRLGTRLKKVHAAPDLYPDGQWRTRR